MSVHYKKNTKFALKSSPIHSLRFVIDLIAKKPKPNLFPHFIALHFCTHTHKQTTIHVYSTNDQCDKVSLTRSVCTANTSNQTEKIYMRCYTQLGQKTSLTLNRQTFCNILVYQMFERFYSKGLEYGVHQTPINKHMNTKIFCTSLDAPTFCVCQYHFW